MNRRGCAYSSNENFQVLWDIIPMIYSVQVELNKEQFDTINNYNLYLTFLLYVSFMGRKRRQTYFLKDL